MTASSNNKLVLWVRAGNADPQYHAFSSTIDAANALAALTHDGKPLRGVVIRAAGGIFLYPSHVGRNWIDCYWGNPDSPDPVVSLLNAEDLMILSAVLAPDPGPDGKPTAETLLGYQLRDAAVLASRPVTTAEKLGRTRPGDLPAGPLASEREAAHKLALACTENGEILRAEAWSLVAVALDVLQDEQRKGTCPDCLAGVKRRGFVFDLLFADEGLRPASGERAMAGWLEQRRELRRLMGVTA